MRRRFRRLFRHVPDRPDLLARELDDEIASHLAARVEQLERLGMPQAKARAEALARFGDPVAARERLVRSASRRAAIMRSRERSEEIHGVIGGLSHDARLALRALRLHPTFAVATIATLGLAIAAAVTAFSFVDAIFLRPLPAPAADRLVHVYLQRGAGVGRVGRAGAALLADRHDVFEQVAAEQCCWVHFVRERAGLDQRYLAYASADFFPMLGIAPALGRFFLANETSTPGGEPVAVLSYTLWQRVFGSDPHVLGEHIVISGSERHFTIVGVAPPGFEGIGIGATPSEIWVPSTMAAALDNGCAPGIPCEDSDVLARLAPGVSIAQAQAALANLGGPLSRLAIGDDSVRRPIVLRASGALVTTQHEYSPLARLLGAIAAVLLLIACANASGLMVVRGLSRAREIALRLSLGARRLRIVQQLMVESAIIALAGAAVGVALSVWTARRLMAFFVTDSEGFETYFRVGLDARILWFALGIGVLSTLLFGVVPALLTSRAQPADVLKSATAGGGGPRRSRVEFIAVQVALTSALLAAAALLSRSFSHLLHAQRFDVDHVALFRVRPAAAQYDTIRAEQYVRAVSDRVSALPGVEDVAFARGAGFVWGDSPVDVGVGAAVGDSARSVNAHFVSPDFFRTLRIAVLTGRAFTSGDVVGAPPVTIVSESVARLLWPGADAIGRTLYAHGKAFRVVGVVPDYRVRMRGDVVLPMVFFAFWQNALGPERDARFAVRVHGDAARALPALRRAAQAVDPYVPVAEVMTLSHQVDTSYPQVRLGQTVLLAAGGLALVLTALGLYGMVAFVVTRRTRDIGLRIALGALPVRVAGNVVASGMSAVMVGLAAGMSAAWVLSRLLSTWLVGVDPHDAVAFAIAAAAVVSTSVVACAIPARRAARIDPAIALRAE